MLQAFNGPDRPPPCLRMQPRQLKIPPTKYWLSALQRATGLPCRCCSPGIALNSIVGVRFVGNETVAEDFFE